MKREKGGYFITFQYQYYPLKKFLSNLDIGGSNQSQTNDFSDPWMLSCRYMKAVRGCVSRSAATQTFVKLSHFHDVEQTCTSILSIEVCPHCWLFAIVSSFQQCGQIGHNIATKVEECNIRYFLDSRAEITDWWLVMFVLVSGIHATLLSSWPSSSPKLLDQQACLQNLIKIWGNSSTTAGHSYRIRIWLVNHSYLNLNHDLTRKIQ